jgi:hypothetical protein
MTSEEYMRDIMQPTIKELAQNRTSKRHAFLACVVTFHMIDYLSGKRRKAVLRGEYRLQSAAFAAVDRIAHGRGESLAPGGTDIVGLVNEAAGFLAKKVGEHASEEDQPANDTYYVVVPFDRNAQGDPEPGLAREAVSAVLARRLARALAAEHGGAIAFSRSGDPETGEFQDPVVLATFGDVDLSALR